MMTRSHQTAVSAKTDSPVALSHTPGVSLHRQLFLALRDRIIRGFWPAGSAIPTEEALCDQFGVSRVTVRRAITDLVAQGLVERRHGLGTFVLADVASPRPDATLSLVEELRKGATDTKVKVLDVEHRTAPPDVAKLLQLAADEKPLHALRLRHKDDVPLMLTDAWVPERLGRKVTAAALQKRALYEVLVGQGVRFGRVVQELSAVAADATTADLLATEVGAPLIKLQRLMHDTKARPVLYITALMSPERSRILMDIPGDAINTMSGGQIVHDGISAAKEIRFFRR